MSTKEETRKRIGQRVRILRTQAGLTQQELADLAGLQRTHIGRIEDGAFGSQVETIQQVAEALGMVVDIVDPGLQDLAPLKRMTPTDKYAHGEAVESKAPVTFDIMEMLKREMKERMERNGNDMDKTAAEMGISKRTLNRKLKKLGLI